MRRPLGGVRGQCQSSWFRWVYDIYSPPCHLTQDIYLNWHRATTMRNTRGGQRMMWEALIYQWVFFPLHICFCCHSLARIFQAQKLRVHVFFQILLWSRSFFARLSYAARHSFLPLFCLFPSTVSFSLLTRSPVLFLLFFSLSTVEKIWIIHFDEQDCRVCMSSVLAYVFAWEYHMGCSSTFQADSTRVCLLRVCGYIDVFRWMVVCLLPCSSLSVSCSPQYSPYWSAVAWSQSAVHLATHPSSALVTVNHSAQREKRKTL